MAVRAVILSKKVVLEEPIGNASTLSLADARGAATIKAGEVAKGVDLREVRRAAREQEAEDANDSHLHLFNFIEQWRASRSGDITFARIKRIYTYLKACINSAVKHYKLVDRFELQNYSLKRKITEKVNPPKIRSLSKKEEIRLLSALEERDKELDRGALRCVSLGAHLLSIADRQPCAQLSAYIGATRRRDAAMQVFSCRRGHSGIH